MSALIFTMSAVGLADNTELLRPSRILLLLVPMLPVCDVSVSAPPEISLDCAFPAAVIAPFAVRKTLAPRSATIRPTRKADSLLATLMMPPLVVVISSVPTDPAVLATCLI